MSDLNEIKTILALLKAYDAAVKEEIFENLVLSGQLKDVIDSSENKPKYSLNLLDVFNVAEPLISKIISLIFKYKRGHDYVLCRSFVEEFLVDCGFDLEWIKRPSITAETGRIDIGIEERGKYTIIIENKLRGACFQRNQIARYIQKKRKSGYLDDSIFVVVLPNCVDDSFFDHINKSVWCLPKDWQSPNQIRRCSYKDDISCLCDFGREDVMCQDCENLKHKFMKQTVVLDVDFINWLEYKCLPLLPLDECLLRSAIVQFVDFLKGVFNNRLNHKLMMDIQRFLREQLIDSNEPLMEQWKTIAEKKEEVGKLMKGLDQLQTSIGKEQIDEWRELLMPQWGRWLKFEKRKSFGINIQGVWCGCWCGEGEKPFWGFRWPNAKEEPTQEQKDMVKNILKETDNPQCGKPEQGWFAWCYTWHGDERCNMFYETALRLGYLE